MLFIVIAVQVLFLMCMPAHEARRILYAENKNVMKNYEDKLFWAVQQGEASLNVPNPAKRPYLPLITILMSLL